MYRVRKLKNAVPDPGVFLEEYTGSSWWYEYRFRLVESYDTKVGQELLKEASLDEPSKESRHDNVGLVSGRKTASDN